MIEVHEFTRLIIIDEQTTSAREWALRKWRDNNRKRIYRQNTDITPQFLRDLWNEASHCIFCGVKMLEWGADPSSRSLDHIKPISKGGLHRRENVRYICRFCNTQKSNMLDDEFLAKFGKKGGIV